MITSLQHPHSVPWPQGRTAYGGLQRPLEPPWPVDGPCSDAPSIAWSSPVLVHQQSLARGANWTPSPPACGAPSQTSAPPVCINSTLALLSYLPTGPKGGTRSCRRSIPPPASNQPLTFTSTQSFACCCLSCSVVNGSPSPPLSPGPAATANGPKPCSSWRPQYDTRQRGMDVWRGRQRWHAVALVGAEPRSRTLGGSPATLPHDPLAGESSASRWG